MTENIKKRRQLTLNEKLVLLDRVDNGEKVTAVAREFGIPSSTASGIVKDRSKIKLLHEHYKLAPHRKRLRLSFFSDVDEAVYMWFQQMRSKNTPVNGPMLQQKAREFALQLGHKNFEGSSGWLFRFRERHNMSVEAMRGENSDCVITNIGMTDDEIISSINHNNSQSEYIVSNVDITDITSENAGIEMPVCSTYLEEENIDVNETSSNNDQNMNFCDSTDEVEETHVDIDNSVPVIKLSEAVFLMKNLTCFFERQTDIPKPIWDSLHTVKDFMLGDLSERCKQKKITDYFK